MWGKIYGQWLCESAVLVYDFDRFDADDILGLFKQYNVTTFCAPPTMYRFFIREDLSRYDLSSLKYACTAGEALNPEVFSKFKEATGLSIMEGFGQTETTLTVGNLFGTTPKPGSMGKPSPGWHVVLHDEDDQEVPDGEPGNIAICTAPGKRPAGLLTEYLDDPAANEKAFRGDYYYTGDRAYKDENGYFWFVGRSDDIIKSSGYRIGPLEVEEVLMKHPAVVEAAVIGVPDPMRGARIKAYIILKDGYEGNENLIHERA
jgi:acetyl-CoA synthetase